MKTLLHACGIAGAAGAAAAEASKGVSDLDGTAEAAAERLLGGLS